MDALWEKHPRRLSEAGLRRSSDHSVVLTEDTDSFIIGERVWVGGTKPGQIAYIGETQFAPGDWAGIVLDDPIGKNDGSVAGTRYFQCAEKRGVFSRLTRLTRAPLAGHDASPVSDAGSVFERPPSGLGRPRRTLSPNGSIRSAVSSKMNASISTTTGPTEVRLGDRVIVSSSRGSKAGTLRYVGGTAFAPGVWAGVELDDPLGKNDGSVDGKRYFECSPRFGLFAPISKVSRSPSNRKPGTCAIHNGRSTPIRRSNSRESLTSLGTSVASSRVRVGALAQELLREKQHHLERLMRERELERSEVAKFTLQAERAEGAMNLLKKEASQANSDNEKLKLELAQLNKMLEDERQKVEDLMFRNEEENINKEEYNKYREAIEKEKADLEQRIQSLETEAALQMSRADASVAMLRALEDQRVIDMANLNEQHKEELTAAQTLSSELQKLLDEAYALLKEKENEKDSLGKSMSEELLKLKTESEKALNEAKTKLAIAKTEFDAQMSVLTAKLQLAETKLDAEKQNLEKCNKENSHIIMDLNAKLAQLQAVVDDKSHELNKLMGASKEHELNLNKEITKLKMELSAKVLDLEQLADSNKKQETASIMLQEEIRRIKEDYTSKVNEYEVLLNEANQQSEKTKIEIFDLQQNLIAKTKENERLLNEVNKSSSSSEKLISEYKEIIHERDKEIIKLKDDLEKEKADFNIKHSKIAEEHKKEIESRNSRIEELLKEIDGKKQALDQSKVDFDKLRNECTLHNTELKTLKEENENLKKTVSELVQANNDLKSKISSMELEIGEHKRQLESTIEKCNELQSAKQKIESEYMNLTGQATDSNDQFNQLSQHLKETEKELQEFKDKHREIVNLHARTEQELKQKIFKLQEDFTLDRGQLVKISDENTEKLHAAEGKINECETKINDLQNRLREKETNSDIYQDENSNLKKEIETLKAKEIDLNTEYETVRKQMENDIEKYKQEISILKAEGANSEIKLMEKVDQLIEAQNDLNNKLEEARKHEDALQKVIDDMTSKLSNQKSQYEHEISQIRAQLSAVNDESSGTKAEETRLKDLLIQKENNVKELTLKIDMLRVDLQSNTELLTEKDRQLSQINEELNKVSDNKKQLEDKFNNVLVETASLKQQYENLISNSSAEETLLKEQQDLLEALKKDNTVLTQEKTSIETKLYEYSEDIIKLKKEHDEALKNLSDHIEINTQLKKTLEEKEQLLKNYIDTNKESLNKLKTLDEELIKLKQDMSNKEAALQEKESQVIKLNEILQSGSSETQNIIIQLQDENNRLNEKYKTETDTLNKICKSLENEIVEKTKELQELEKNKDKVTELQALVAKSEDDIKQLTNINEAQKLNYEDLNKQLQVQFDEYKKDSKRVRHELKAKIDEYEKTLQESKVKLDIEVEKQNKLQVKLTETENNLLELSNKLELVTVQQSASVEKDDKLEKLTLELQSIRKSNAEALANSDAIVKSLRSDIENKLKELKQKDELICKLQEDVRNTKAKIEIAEREKVILQKEMTSKSKDFVVKDNNDNRAIGQGDEQSQQLAEDKAMAEGQVSFLNSVIVDMQRKNEQLMARVQALEGGAPEPPTTFNGRKPRAVAPRLFCDICDVFDAHDTDECPRQSAEPPPAKKTPPPPRPYCDICEVFGHSTENCDEEETF